jgi:hypothetical protein
MRMRTQDIDLYPGPGLRGRRKVKGVTVLPPDAAVCVSCGCDDLNACEIEDQGAARRAARYRAELNAFGGAS